MKGLHQRSKCGLKVDAISSDDHRELWQMFYRVSPTQIGENGRVSAEHSYQFNSAADTLPDKLFRSMLRCNVPSSGLKNRSPIGEAG